MLKKIRSYFAPIKLVHLKSSLSKTIEVSLEKGKLVLNTENTNYSYGNLQQVLKYGLQNIGASKIATMRSVLVLGVAGGSVIKTLLEDFQFKGKITGVEIDPVINQVATDYFKLDQIPQLEIIIEDAFAFVLKTKNTYDLIIIDVFQDTKMPNFLFQSFFVNRVCFLLKPNGTILFNTMLLTPEDTIRNKKYVQDHNLTNYKIRTLPRMEAHNELIVIEKQD
ncbi:spermidine synthase [Flavobacterium crassostreae]|uniref:Spermidine synthase n=1 Tax=Flavobacterium crassostreae TaxID=1763534 RepID=A0A1B9E9H1_9FLAO|nr:fused MFS/spermidine synthase [Flavobacterium crassostreae]OCB78586.1 spermidine synthase [Flavobacterium crassostreae]